MVEVRVKMNLEKIKANSVWILISMGILIALASALENHWTWLANLCGEVTSGCREASDFTLLSLPIAYWGIVFYLLLALLNRFARKLVFWAVMAAVGVEITFLWLMYSLKMPCLFCLINGAVMLLLFILLFRKKLIIQTTALALAAVCFFAFHFLLIKENRDLVAAAALSESNQSAEGTQDKLLDINIENSPFIGPSDSKVLIIEFSDYMCPACRKFHPISMKLKKEYKDRVKWVFKDFPLRQHKGADRLAEMARCANDQGKFWEFQEALFNVPLPFNFDVLPQIAVNLGLDIQQFAECVENRKYLFEVIQDRQDALNAGINSTPSVVLNGRKLKDFKDEETFRKIIDEALANTK